MDLLWLILGQALRHPTRIAAIDDQRRWRYLDLLGGAMHVAEMIDAHTDAPHVAICLPTSGAFSMTLLGTWLAGRTAVPLNYLLGPDELTYVMADCDADTLITVGPMLELIGGSRTIPDHVRILDLTQIDPRGAPPLRWPPAPRPAGNAVILYTSGTSGRPKGVMLTHRNLLSNVEAAIAHARITRLDGFLGVLPQFHSFGLTALTLIPLRVGATTAYSARFVPRRIVELIRNHRPSIFMAVPSMYAALLSVKEATPEDFRSIRLPVSGGEPLPDAIFESFQDRFGVSILEGYGLTETAPVTNWSTPDRQRRHSVGLSLPDVRVVTVDEHDHLLGPDAEGEILIHGPNVMRGYYKLPDLTREVFADLPDGGAGGRRFFRTGDIGHVDRDGYLFITGRKKEMLIIGGENVFPRQIEEALNRHESVRESAVIGERDDVRGEVPVAFVELNDGAELDEAALRSFCRDHLAPFKVPRRIERVDELPRSPTGKIMRRRLAEAGGRRT